MQEPNHTSQEWRDHVRNHEMTHGEIPYEAAHQMHLASKALALLQERPELVRVTPGNATKPYSMLIRYPSATVDHHEFTTEMANLLAMAFRDVKLPLPDHAIGMNLDDDGLEVSWAHLQEAAGEEKGKLDPLQVAAQFLAENKVNFQGSSRYVTRAK